MNIIKSGGNTVNAALIIMKTKASFIDPERIKVEVPTGEIFIIGFCSIMNYRINEKLKWSIPDDLVAPTFDKHYDGDSSEMFDILNTNLLKNNCNPILWLSEENNQDKVRIGARIKQLRKEKNIEAKELAENAGIDAANLCRIEQGKYSVGISVLSKIADALECKIDLVPNQPTQNE